MTPRPLGPTGLAIAPIVFGGNVLGWTLPEDEAFRVLDAFVDHGFDAIDTADVYSIFAGTAPGTSEEVLGRWFAARPGMRERVTLITKVGLDMGGVGEKGLSPRWIAEGSERSLKRLKTDRIDLYFAHVPDPDTPPADTLAAFGTLIDAGKVRALGASNYDADTIRAALDVADDEGLAGFQVVQPRYNVADRGDFEGPMRELCIERGLGVITYFSLANGFLTGKYRTMAEIEASPRAEWLRGYMSDENLALVTALHEVADRHRARPAEVALAWSMAQPGVTAPIASATSVEQVASFARAAALTLSAEDLAALG
ncbi:MAG TPA: aldo/keto reductase [Croceicoccus sp.]|nr:aldo/keto reductase [Croceicoccus sp.]